MQDPTPVILAPYPVIPPALIQLLFMPAMPPMPAPVSMFEPNPPFWGEHEFMLTQLMVFMLYVGVMVGLMVLTAVLIALDTESAYSFCDDNIVMTNNH